jgi:hypothetical protein
VPLAAAEDPAERHLNEGVIGKFEPSIFGKVKSAHFGKVKSAHRNTTSMK